MRATCYRWRDVTTEVLPPWTRLGINGFARHPKSTFGPSGSAPYSLTLAPRWPTPLSSILQILAGARSAQSRPNASRNNEEITNGLKEHRRNYEWKALRVEGITNGRYYEWKVYCILPFGVIPKLLRTDAPGFPNQTYGGLCLERFHQSMLRSSWGFVWRGSDVDPVLISQKSAQNGSLRLARIRVCPQRVSVEEMLLRRYSHPRHVF